MAKNSLSIRKENKSRRLGQRERWKQKTEFLGGDGLMAPFSTRKEGRDDDDDNFFLSIQSCTNWFSGHFYYQSKHKVMLVTPLDSTYT